MDKTLANLISYPTPGRESYLVNDSDYQVKETGETRIREFYAWFPVYLGQQDLIPLPGCKFTWFRKVRIVQKEVMSRCTDFDSGWTYQSYWKSWTTKWITIDITRL